MTAVKTPLLTILAGYDAAQKASARAALEAASSLSIVSLTDANTTLTANRTHILPSSLSANRTYSVPTGAAGDVIRVMCPTAYATNEAIISGATGVTINGGSAASEWSRLFIAGESVTLFCTGGGVWIVLHDGRIPQVVLMPEAVVTNAFAVASYSKMPLLAATTAIGNTGDEVNDQVIVRRSSPYRFGGVVNFFSSTTHQALLAYNAGGVRLTRRSGTFSTSLDSQTRIGMTPEVRQLSVGDAVFIEVYIDTTRTSQGDGYLLVEEIL